jgi:retron-type reverse transcriptase
MKSGIFTELGGREESLTEIPQGGILSLLLVNIALSAMDDHFDRQWHQRMGTQEKQRKRTRHGEGNWNSSAMPIYADIGINRIMSSRRVNVLVNGVTAAGWSA